MNSPFKFLDAYEQGDKDIFFGRNAEVEQLYRLMFEANLVLVYGQSGTGKTSLIQCGLANRFQPTDWFQVFVRRQEDINRALNREIRAHAVTEIPPDASAVEAVRSLYLDHLRPIYLIFDQFEELFILGSTDEQEAFIATVAELLASDVSCKIIVSLREEYLAMLHRFEKAVPTLFNKRLRVEPMSMTNVRQVILGTTGALGIRLEHGEATAQKIIDSLDDPRVGVQLAYLQVYLDRLYRHAAAGGSEGPIVFTDKAVEETGKLGDIMEDFLEEQTAAIQADVAAKHPGIDPNFVQHMLEEFVTVEGTKQPMNRAALAARLPAAEPRIDEVLAALQKARILRRNDEQFELAHDSLARRIAERRSGERKALLIVQKLVRDRLAAFDQTKTWLNRDELAVVRRGGPRLELAEPEAAFVRRSASKAGWRRMRWVSALATTGLVLLTLLGTAGYFLLQAEETFVRAQNDTDEFAYYIYTQLRAAESADEIREVRSSVLNSAALINGGLVSDSFFGDREDEFWYSLLEADLARESGDPASARRFYFNTARALRPQLRADPEDLQARIRLRAVIARLADSEEDPARQRQLYLELLRIVTAETSAQLVKFDDGIATACIGLEGHLPEDSGPGIPECRSFWRDQMGGE
ncbi:MAG: ATP-binding protein [Allosphingosinicella sp.]